MWLHIPHNETWNHDNLPQLDKEMVYLIAFQQNPTTYFVFFFGIWCVQLRKQSTSLWLIISKPSAITKQQTYRYSYLDIQTHNHTMRVISTKTKRNAHTVRQKFFFTFQLSTLRPQMAYRDVSHRSLKKAQPLNFYAVS